MTRIIAGSAGGRRLSTPSGATTRPTSDRVREAVFSTLESSLGSWAGVRFLDLFAGSGAVGLEAVSRGAARTTLVEKHRRAAGLARRNAASLRLAEVEVVAARVDTFLLRPHHECFHVVYADPPYTLDGAVVTHLLTMLVEHAWLCDDAVVAVERPARDPDLRWPEGIRGDRTRRYGETAVWYGRATDRPRDDPPVTRTTPAS